MEEPGPRRGKKRCKEDSVCTRVRAPGGSSQPGGLQVG